MSDINENQSASPEDEGPASDGEAVAASEEQPASAGGLPERPTDGLEESTHAGPPPDAANDVHELTTAAPEQSAMVDDPEATDPAAAADGPPVEEEIGAGGVGSGTEEKGIRVPPPQDPPRPIHSWPMRSAMGGGELVMISTLR